MAPFFISTVLYPKAKAMDLAAETEILLSYSHLLCFLRIKSVIVFYSRRRAALNNVAPNVAPAVKASIAAALAAGEAAIANNGNILSLLSVLYS